VHREGQSFQLFPGSGDSRCRRPERSEETVDVATITNVHDDNDQAGLFDLVDDTIVSTSDPVEVIHSLEFLDAGRTGDLG